MRYLHATESLYPDINRAVGDFVSNIVFGRPGELRDYCTLGVFDGNMLVAGTVYHNYHPDSGVVELTSGSTSKKWLNRETIKHMMGFAFASLRCQAVILRVPERNKNVLRMARASGFSEVFVPRLRGRNEGEFILTYTDDDWNESRFRRKNGAIFS